MYNKELFSPDDLQKSNILVVDDEFSNVLLLEKILASRGYNNVISTQDPTQVLALYQQHSVDLILLDLNMPKLDGFEVMEQLNQLTDHQPVPILLLAAQHMQSYRQKALDYGARDYVTKPFDTDELISRVRNLLEVRLAHKFMLKQNDILEKKIQKRTKLVTQTRLQIIRHLGRAAEYRDNETGLHIVRMSKISAVIAKATGLDEQQCELILNAAPMHDVGKIGIPDRILLKPGKLNDEEWVIMQTHAQIGAEVLTGDNSKLISMARDIAISHHEKWNGLGYPNALKGEEIPLVGRICAIADVFDALTSKRPYKQAWTIERSINFIQQESGQHFDPTLTELFLQNLDEIVTISQNYAEPET